MSNDKPDGINLGLQLVEEGLARVRSEKVMLFEDKCSCKIGFKINFAETDVALKGWKGWKGALEQWLSTHRISGGGYLADFCRGAIFVFAWKLIENKCRSRCLSFRRPGEVMILWALHFRGRKARSL